MHLRLSVCLHFVCSYRRTELTTKPQTQEIKMMDAAISEAVSSSLSPVASRIEPVVHNIATNDILETRYL